MSLGQTKSAVLGSIKRTLHLEALESRRVLDGAGLELPRFESADEVEQYLIDDALNRYSNMFEQQAWHWSREWWIGCPVCDLALPEVAVPDAGAIPPPAPDHSDTNTQVAGVDEADIVETDGNFLYTLSGQELIITDAWQPSDIEVVSRFEIDGQPVGQYLNGDRLTIISNVSQDNYFNPWLGGGAPPIFIIDAIDVDFGFWGPYVPPSTSLTVLDVSDRSDPQLVQTTEFEGSYISSRAIGEFVYLVTNSDFALPEPEVNCSDSGEEPCFYESQKSYFQRMEGNLLEFGVPQFSTTNAFGREIASGPLSQPTDIFKPAANSYSNMITVSVVDTSLVGPQEIPSISTPSSYSTTVYASTDSLYLTNPDWGSTWSRQDESAIIKFDIIDDGRRVDLVASGSVPGRLLNSFSMDEYNDNDGGEFFRVATTGFFGRDTINRVFVMQQNDGVLDVIGQTDPLAPGERIFSVRYSGTTGYVVTFRQTDPLFTIDLSVPTEPRVLGELHITGFSNYLQSVGNGYLLGLGREADPRTGRAQELQISLFDVSDLSNPTLADRYTFDVPQWAWSEAISDHHAVGYYPEFQVLAIPVSNDGWVWVDRNGDGTNDFQTYRPRTDLYVFDIDFPEVDADRKAQINFLGTIEHDAAVRRSVRIENFLYSVSDDSISVHQIQDPSNEISRIHFGQEDVGVPVYGADVTNPTVIDAIEKPETVPPQVVHVRASSTQWDQKVINYLDLAPNDDDPSSILPFLEADQIKVQFSEDVLVGQNDLRIRGRADSYAIQSFDYDVDTKTAIWNLSKPFEIDKINLQLRGLEDLAGNRLDGNANGRPGGVFRYEFSVLPGDVDRDGRVDRADLASAMSRATANAGDEDYLLSHDIDGSGRIDLTDFIAIASLAGTSLPDFVEPVAGDANGDGQFDSNDLIQVMTNGFYRTGEFATYQDGDWNRDGLFDESDFVFAFQKGTYVTPASIAARLVDAALADDDD